MAITWRNVGQTVSAGDAAQLFRGANASIQGGLDKITGALRNVETGREDQYNTEVQTNTDSFLNALNQYDSVEELQAAQEAGDIDRLRDSFGNRIDQGVARTAFDQAMSRERGELTAERQDLAADQDFAQRQAMQVVKPLYDEYQALVAKDPEAGARMLEENHEEFASANLLSDAQQALFRSESAGFARQAEKRAHNEAIRAQEETRQRRQATEIVGDFITSADDPVSGRAAAKEAAEAAGLPSTVYLPLISEFPTMWGKANGLTDTETREITQATLSTDRLIQEETAQAQVARDSFFANHPVKYTPDATVGDVSTALSDRGINHEGALSHVRDGFNLALENINFARNAEGGYEARIFEGVPNKSNELPPELRPYEDRILAELAATLNADRGFWDNGTSGIAEDTKSELANTTLQIIDDVLLSETNRVKRAEAEHQLASTVREIENRHYDNLSRYTTAKKDSVKMSTVAREATRREETREQFDEASDYIKDFFNLNRS